MRKFYSVISVMIMIMMFYGVSEGVIRDGGIRGKNGLSFGSIHYEFGNVSVVINNGNGYNVNFGGSMLFLDKNYKVVARAELLSAKIKRHSSRKYKAFFSYGSGNEAKSAKYLEWEFN